MSLYPGKNRTGEFESVFSKLDLSLLASHIVRRDWSWQTKFCTDKKLNSRQQLRAGSVRSTCCTAGNQTSQNSPAVPVPPRIVTVCPQIPGALYCRGSCLAAIPNPHHPERRVCAGPGKESDPCYQRSAPERRSHGAAPAKQTAPICCSEGNMPAETFLLHRDPSAPALIFPPD